MILRPALWLSHTLDAWLWRRGLHHPLIRALVLAQALFAGAVLVLGMCASPITLWPLWFAVGALIMAQIFWGIAHHMTRLRLDAYHSMLLIGVLLRFGTRLLFTAIVLYVALIVCHAPATALVCGMTAGTTVAIATFALASRAGHNL